MIQGLNGAVSASGLQAAADETAAAQDRGQQEQAFPGAWGDAYTVTISDRAKARLAAAVESGAEAGEADTEQKPSAQEYWEKLLGVSSGASTTADGNRLKVTVKGDAVEVLEYAGSRLVRKTTGMLGASGVDLTTEVYDRSGRTTQKIQTHFTGLDSDLSVTSSSGMTRTTQWFDGRQLVRQMEESMRLSSSYSGTPNADAFERLNLAQLADSLGGSGQDKPTDEGTLWSLLDFAGSLTKDTQKTDYYATVTDYADGRVTQRITIDQANSYENTTNHGDAVNAGRDPHSTEQTRQEARLFLRVESYDAQGNILRDVSFSDTMDSFSSSGVQHRQSLSVSWYVDGERVKRSQGELTMERGENTDLETRPTLLQFLNVDEADYAADTPLNASEILSLGLTQAATDSGHFKQALKADVESGRYDTAGDVARGNNGDRPYTLEWTNEIYSEGELVARQRDVESATGNRTPEDTLLRTGGGLTEDARPALLHRTEHVEEAYEGGHLTTRGVISSHEYIFEGDRQGPDEVRTATHAEKQSGLKKIVMNDVYAATIEDVDADRHAASEAFSLELGLSLGDLRETLTAVNSAGKEEEAMAGMIGE